MSSLNPRRRRRRRRRGPPTITDPPMLAPAAPVVMVVMNDHESTSSPPSRGKTAPPSRQLSCRDPSEYPGGCLGHIPSRCVAENGCRRRVRTERGRRAAVVVPPSRCWPEEEEKGHAQTGHGVSPNRVDAQPAPQSASIAAEGCLATTRAVPGRTVAGGTLFTCRSTADQRLQV